MNQKIVQGKFMNDMETVYRMINNILYDYESSEKFTCFPGTQDECYEYYDKLVQNIRKKVDSAFWYCLDVRGSLYKIVDDISHIVRRSYEMPGVPGKWLVLNPRLYYFDGVYSMIEEDFESYKKIKNGEMCFAFSFVPTLEEYIERKKYLKEKLERYTECNITATEERMYQDELIDTFSIVFSAEMSRYLVN